MFETPLSAENVEKLFHESHFQAATSSMSPLGKDFLRHYLHVKTNIPTITTFVERVAMASNNSKRISIVSPTTMVDLEVVAAAVHPIQNQNERSRLDIYLLTSHPIVGNSLYNTYDKEESIAAIGLKCTDSLIDKASKEVEEVRKAAEASKTSVLNNPRGRGRGRVRGNDYSDRNGHNNYESYNNGVFHHNNNSGYRGHNHGYRGDRGGFHSGNFNGSYQSNPTNGCQGNGYQTFSFETEVTSSRNQSAHDNPNLSMNRMSGWEM
jgi:hypothetical protein